MPSRRPESRWPARAVVAAAVLTALIVIGALVWFVPYLKQSREAAAETPGPNPLFVAGGFTIPPRREGCMDSVGIPRDAHLAVFNIRPAVATPRGGPPLELRLQAPGYLARAQVPAGYPGGVAAIPIRPPASDVIGSACFLNRGGSPLLIAASTEPRTVSRSPTTVAGRQVYGDIVLSFVDNGHASLWSRLGDVFGHASALTDRLVPVWLVWVIATLIAFGVPTAIVLALFLALREDDLAADA